MDHTPGIEPAEVLRLAMIVLATPPFLILAARLRQRAGLAWLYASFFAVMVSHILAVVEDVTPIEPLLDMVQHSFYGVAGVLAAVGMLVMWRSKLEGGAGA